MPKPRKSLQEHLLTGTTPNWSEEESSSDFAPAMRLRCPKDLSPAAADAWRRLVRNLRKRKILTAADESLLEIYARVYARWKKACDEVEEGGATIISKWVDSNGVEHQRRVENPASKIAARLETSLRQILSSFGATPVARPLAKPLAPAGDTNPPAPDSVEALEYMAAELLAPTPGDQQPDTSLEDFDETKIC